MDMLMLTLQNGREREMDDWKQLLKRADERFNLTTAIAPEKSAIGVIEVIWEGEAPRLACEHCGART